MPACPRDNQHSTLPSPPPGFTDANVVLKREQLIELLKNVIDKYQQETLFVAQQPKQTDLLFSIAQLTLLSTPNDRREFLNNIVTITQDLLADENNTDIASSIDSCSPSNENTVLSPSSILPSNTTTNDVEGDFSLDDLANEYLQNESTPSSLNDKQTTPSESDESDLTIDNLSKTHFSSSPSTPITNVLSALVSPAISTEPILIKPQLESILFSNRLSSNDAADDADSIWKEESSPFSQVFCKKIDEIDSTPTKRISTCLLDRSLYERLTRLIILLPKQCIRNSVQQLSIRPNDQPHRPPRSNHDNRRPPNRPSFQQNSLQSYQTQRYPNPQNPRPYPNFNYSYQQGNPNGHFIDRRSQQQNRYPPTFAPYPGDQQYQPRGPPKNNSYNNSNQQPKKKPQTNNQQAPNQQQRGTKKGSGGGGNKSAASGSDPNVNPK
jgi:hypothetical protein